MTSPHDDRLRRSFDYEADAESIARARRDVSEFVVGRFRSADDEPSDELRWLVERLALVVSELSANAVAAAPGQWFRVGIMIDTATDGSADRPAPRVTCCVTNPHTGDDAPVPRFGAVPDALAERGRGLVIVDGLADQTPRVDRSADTTEVIVELGLSANH